MLDLQDTNVPALLGRASCFLDLGLASSALVDAQMALQAPRRGSSEALQGLYLKARSLATLGHLQLCLPVVEAAMDAAAQWEHEQRVRAGRASSSFHVRPGGLEAVS